MTSILRNTLALALLAALASCTAENVHWGSAAKPTASAAKSSQPVIRINFGRDEPYKDSTGNTWLGDTGVEGGDVVDRGAELAIKNTKDADLFRTEHWGMDAFSYKVPNGHYTVKLYFCETSEHIGNPGERVFTFTVEGKEFKDFDVIVKAGGFATPYVETVPVDIKDGKLDVVFTAVTENPEINAIEIIPG